VEKIDLGTCDPPFWARGGHAQTIWGHLLPSEGLRDPGELVEIPLEGGDRLSARYHAGRGDAVVYLFHGLAGTNDAGYMRRTARLALALGYGVYRVNHRGCGEGAGLARALYHSGRGEDLGAAIAFGRARHPGARAIAIGFSLSGSALLNLLTGLRGEHPPDAAITVNAPLDLRAHSRSLGMGLNRLYDARFVAQLRRDLRAKYALGHLPEDPSGWRGRSVHDFDAAFTARLSGFADREAYYDSCSTGPQLTKIRVPTVLLTAEDDPFVAYAPYAEAKLSPSTVLQAQRVGGHMGYVTSSGLGGGRWLDTALHRLLDSDPFRKT